MNKEIQDTINKVNSSRAFVGFTECVKEVTESLVVKFFYGYFDSESKTDEACFDKCLEKALSYCIDDVTKRQNIEEQIHTKLPMIFDNICMDIEAAFGGDPAAKNYDEIILTYPCFRAISAYRFAHELYILDVPILPRAISEYAHRLTGIDIHPGATIGKKFFIDHGTGVVIGETTIIGNNVTLYQNVTLGAKSFPRDVGGNIIKGVKRHPNIGNDVVVYAGTTILGNISISDGVTIPGNS